MMREFAFATLAAVALEEEGTGLPMMFSTGITGAAVSCFSIFRATGIIARTFDGSPSVVVTWLVRR